MLMRIRGNFLFAYLMHMENDEHMHARKHDRTVPMTAGSLPPVPLPYRSTFGVACPPPSYPFKQHFLLPCLTACVVHSHKGAPLLLQLLSRLHINIVPEAENGPRPVGFSEVLSPPLESSAGLEMEL